MNLINALNNGYNILKSKKIHSYKIDTELLLSNSLNISKEDLILNLDRNINLYDYKKFIYKLERRKAREPIAYILNKKEFWKNDFYVNDSVLIPRHETEHLIEETLKIIPENKRAFIGNWDRFRVSNLSILKDRKKCFGIGIDCCEKAVKVANINANLHQLKNRIKILNQMLTILTQVNMI